MTEMDRELASLLAVTAVLWIACLWVIWRGPATADDWRDDEPHGDVVAWPPAVDLRSVARARRDAAHRAGAVRADVRQLRMGVTGLGSAASPGAAHAVERDRSLVGRDQIGTETRMRRIVQWK